VEERGDALHLDAATRRNLEIDVSLSGQDSATLFALLDSTVTAMGSRNLRRWLNRPLTDQQQLRRRYQAVALMLDARRFEAFVNRCGPSATWNAFCRAWPCAARDRAISRPCAHPLRRFRRCARSSSASTHR
jgi:hypothetical protein